MDVSVSRRFYCRCLFKVLCCKRREVTITSWRPSNLLSVFISHNLATFGLANESKKKQQKTYLSTSIHTQQIKLNQRQTQQLICTQKQKRNQTHSRCGEASCKQGDVLRWYSWILSHTAPIIIARSAVFYSVAHPRFPKQGARYQSDTQRHTHERKHWNRAKVCFQWLR